MLPRGNESPHCSIVANLLSESRAVPKRIQVRGIQSIDLPVAVQRLLVEPHLPKVTTCVSSSFQVKAPRTWTPLLDVPTPPSHGEDVHP